MTELPYHEQRDRKNEAKLQELLSALPLFCADFFRGIETSTSTRTRIAYAYDLKIFFQFLKTANPGTFGNPSHTLTPSDLEKLTVTDLEEYIDYLKCHPSDTNEDVINTERGLMRKVSSLRSFYSYFFRNERIEKNPAALVRMPKLHEKEIIRLVANGYSNKEIAAEMYLGEGTVRNYLSSILDKLQLRDRTQVAVFYYKHR